MRCLFIGERILTSLVHRDSVVHNELTWIQIWQFVVNLPATQGTGWPSSSDDRPVFVSGCGVASGHTCCLLW